MSPRRKKRRTNANNTKSEKRANNHEESSNKRPKANDDEDIQTQRRKNFVTACEEVSCKAYLDYRARLLLLSMPSCIKDHVYRHEDNIIKNEILPHAVDTFMIDIRANMWCEALEVCALCITPTQYLSANVLREIVEIMLNAHHDEFADYTIPYLLSKCQHVFLQNISTHPPCLTKAVNQTYIDFLTSPMDSKEKTFTNRTQFGYSNGVVKYCLNRLEYEISAESPEECLVDKDKNTPKDMQHSLKGFYWQKEKLEIYECLERTERIERLMAALDSIIELLQNDLAIWLCRYKTNLNTRILVQKSRPLMAHILWLHNVFYTGILSNECRQIIKIFAVMVHLRYPQKYIRVITNWLNVVVQVFYICDKNSNSDYPNTGKHSLGFANTFYKIIEEMPFDSIIRIIETVQPTYMKHLIGTLHLKKLLNTEEQSIAKNLTDFITESTWERYPKSEGEIELLISAFQRHRIGKHKLSHLFKICAEWKSRDVPDNEETCYPKMSLNIITEDEEVSCNHVTHTLFVTFQAYLDAYSVQDVQDTIDKLNKKLGECGDSDVIINETLPVLHSYSATEDFLKKYRSIFQMLKDLVVLFQSVKDNNSGELPEALRIFRKIELFDI